MREHLSDRNPAPGTVETMNDDVTFSPARPLSERGRGAASSRFPVVMFDEAHSQAWSIDPAQAAVMNPTQPADASMHAAAEALRAAGSRVSAHAAGPITAALLAGVDVLVTAHPSDPKWESTTGGSPVYTADELAVITEWVRGGGGLVVLAEHEHDKYANNLNELLNPFEIRIEHASVVDTDANRNGVVAWVRPDVSPHPVTARIGDVTLYRTGTLTAGDDATVLLTASAKANHPSAALAAATTAGTGRVVVFTDSDLFGDDSIDDGDHRSLWVNVITWVGTSTTDDGGTAEQLPAAWATLKRDVTELRAMQNADGSITFDQHDPARAPGLLAEILRSIGELTESFPHDRAYLAQVVADLQRWADGGFGVPDFLDSLALFRPERERRDGLAHLVVFNMYTQNGNRNRQLEALIVRVVWPTWIDELEASGYDNKAFVPIELVDFTAGYDTHSAVLFPETVSTREVPAFHWGGILCDREAARFRRISTEAAALLKLELPVDATLLLSDHDLAKETFVMWDLVHDRTHSHGELPFDPFMIRQRMPFWLYALEELRCDLNAYVETFRLAEAGYPHARLVRYAILLDRLVRFPITGERVRNYDGLGGQILFAHLHRSGVLSWRDNTLSIDWDRVDAAVAALAARINAVYREGIDRSRLGHWLASYQLVTELVPAHPASAWSSGSLDLSLPAKELVNAVHDDEFPLNVFYEALAKKLAPAIASCVGISGVQR
jgi:hypothetical protein